MGMKPCRIATGLILMKLCKTVSDYTLFGYDVGVPRSLRIKHIQTKLSAIETRHVYIVNTYKVYNNKNSNELRTYMSGSRGCVWGGGGRGVPILPVFTTQAKE